MKTGIAGTVSLTVLIGGSALLRPYRRQLEPVWKAAKVGFVAYMVVSAVFALVVLYVIFNR
ncbi:MAG: hypothetical protein ABW190_03465 [Rhizobacter sp.]